MKKSPSSEEGVEGVCVTAFNIFWRLAVLVLPWQTRWFVDATLNGWPWEQGRWSFYVSWFFLMATIGFGWNKKSLPLTKGELRGSVAMFSGLFVSTGLALVLNPDWQFRFPAVMQWWIQVVILGFFVWTLWRARVSFKSLATMFVISLLPEAVLGFWQFAAQTVVGSTWLGIATHLVQTPGTIVIEQGAERILRIYGGFPHPNIFGGWLAIGLVAAFWLSSTHLTPCPLSFARRGGSDDVDSAGPSPSEGEGRVRWYPRFQSVFWVVVSVVFSIALFLTYSRSAWIAACFGLAAWFVSRWKHRKDEPESLRMMSLAFVCCVVAILVVAIPQRENLFTRIGASQRLEAKSTDQRLGSLRDGISIFLEHPFFGTGSNAELLHVKPVGNRPLEPPHNVLLLALDDIGVVGFVPLLFVTVWFLATISRRPHKGSVSALAISAIFLALPDHYLWSFWSGQALFAIVIALILLASSRLDESPNSWQSVDTLV